MPLKDFEKKIRGEVKNLIVFDGSLSISLDKNVAKQFAWRKIEFAQKFIDELKLQDSKENVDLNDAIDLRKRIQIS